MPVCVYITHSKTLSVFSLRAGGQGRVHSQHPSELVTEVPRPCLQMVLQIWSLYNSSVAEKTHFKQFIATIETNKALKTLHLSLAIRV